MSKQEQDEEFEIIWVASYTDPRTGRRIVAAKYGKKAFPLKVRKRK